MDYLSMATLGGAAIGAIGGVFNNERNLNYQSEQIEYQKQLQNQMFAREDNAVQRRVADLRAAGLSPVLAAGSAAQAGPVVDVKPKSSNLDSAIDNVASAPLRAAQTQQSIMAAKAAEANVGLIAANTAKAKAQTLVAAREAGIFRYISPGKWSHPKYEDVWGRRAQSAINSATQVLDTLNPRMDRARPNLPPAAQAYDSWFRRNVWDYRNFNNNK